MKKRILSLLALAVAGLCSSCQTNRLADMGDYRVTAFAPAAPASYGSAPGIQPVVLNAGAPPHPSYASTLDPEAVRQYTPNEFVVKTTAYTHSESDSLEYGTLNAAGSDLRYGRVRSAAADWSRYPLGTRFRIKGLPYEYVVDDYGRALVGTDTIDLYKPDSNYMNQWGARDVGIEVLEWGSFEESKRILEGRKNKPDADHVRRMLRNIEEKIDKIPAQLRDGFRA